VRYLAKKQRNVKQPHRRPGKFQEENDEEILLRIAKTFGKESRSPAFMQEPAALTKSPIAIPAPPTSTLRTHAIRGETDTVQSPLALHPCEKMRRNNIRRGTTGLGGLLKIDRKPCAVGIINGGCSKKSLDSRLCRNDALGTGTTNQRF
jgi:hypothetical protein